MKSGIYKITNIINNKCYIGSSNNLNIRKSNHFSCLRRNVHDNKHLQSSFNKYGIENFIFEKLEECEIEHLFPREQFYFEKFNPQYNKTIIAKSCQGIKYSEERKRLCGLANLGNHHSEETKRLISEANKGKQFSEEYREKLSKASLGKSKSLEARQKMSESKKGKPSPRKGVIVSEESKLKMRLAKLGKKRGSYKKNILT